MDATFFDEAVTVGHLMQKNCTMREETTHALMKRYRETGLPEDLAKLFDEAAPSLFEVALHLTTNAQQAEDLVQDTFLAIMHALKRWNPRRSASPWLMGILRREARHRARRERRRPQPERLPERAVTRPDENAENNERNSTLRSAIAGLPNAYREVIEIVFEENVAPAEIARRLEMTPGAVRTRLHRGLALLRKALPAGAAMPAVLVPFKSGGMESVRSAVLAQAASTAPAAVAAGVTATVGTAWVIPGVVVAALVVVVGVASVADGFLGGDAEDDELSALTTTVGAADVVTRPAPRMSSPGRADAAPPSEDLTPPRPRETLPVADTKASDPGVLREGTFTLHYRQGWSFARGAHVPEEEADLWFRTCAGGISSIRFSAPDGVAGFPHLPDLGEGPSVDCFRRAVLSVEEARLGSNRSIHCDDREAWTDVFVLKTRDGGYALCSILDRKEAGGDWQKNDAVLAYVWNSSGPVFDDTRRMTRVEKGFLLDMHAFDSDPWKEAKRRRYADERKALFEEVARIRDFFREEAREKRIGVALTRRHAQGFTSDVNMASEFSAFDFTKPRPPSAPDPSADRDFADWGGRLRLQTVTDDRSQGWNLGSRPNLESWSPEDLAGLSAKTMLDVAAGNLLLIHSLDRDVDRWTIMRILGARPNEGLAFTWKVITDVRLLQRIMRGLRDPNKEMRTPVVRIRMRGGAGGGNPRRVFLDGSKNAYLDDLVQAPFETEGVIGIKERSRAYLEGGLIPWGQVWVVTRVEYTATTAGDSNGPGGFTLRLGGKTIVRLKRLPERTTARWDGELVLKSGDERSSYAEILNSSAADIEIFGYFTAR